MSQVKELDDCLNPHSQPQKGDRKVVIVGATAAFALPLSSLTDEIILIDIDCR